MKLAIFALLVASAQAVRTASSVCVYNDAAFVLKWKLQNKDTGATSSESSSYPVWSTKCMTASSLPGLNAGSSLVPVVSAVWGKTITIDEPVLFDPVNATQVTYVCKGVTWDFSCTQRSAPPTSGDIAKDVEKFTLGFAEGLGAELGFADCLNDANATFDQIKALVDFMEVGFNVRKVSSIVKAFELTGDVLKDFGEAIGACVKDSTSFASKVKEVAGLLSGNVLEVIKVVVQDAVHIFHDRTEITTDAKKCTTFWHAGDYKGAGQAVGAITGIILNGL